MTILTNQSACQMTSFNQLEFFIYVWQSYTRLKLVYDIDSELQR